MIKDKREAEREKLDVLKYYESLIRHLSRFCPKLYKYDLQQELRALVLTRLFHSETGNVHYPTMVLQLGACAKQFIKVEKTKGMTYVSDKIEIGAIRFKGEYNLNQLADGTIRIDNKLRSLKHLKGVDIFRLVERGHGGRSEV